MNMRDSMSKFALKIIISSHLDQLIHPYAVHSAEMFKNCELNMLSTVLKCLKIVK